MSQDTPGILIVDDEILICEYISDVLKSYGYSDFRMAHDLNAAIELTESYKPDLVLLDIRMEKGLEGLEMGELLTHKYKIPFIYISANSEKDIIEKAVVTRPSGYITKPIKSSDLFAAVRMCLQGRSSATDYITIKDGYSIVRILLSTVLFAESDGNYIHIHTDSRKYTIRQTLEWFEETVNSQDFMRVHRSYFIRLDRISRINSLEVYIGQHPVPVSRKHWSDFKVRVHM